MTKMKILWYDLSLLKIIDFGISGFHSGNIKEIIKAGTTRFIPPEVYYSLR
jgi:hypothetical protein